MKRLLLMAIAILLIFPATQLAAQDRCYENICYRSHKFKVSETNVSGLVQIQLQKYGVGIALSKVPKASNVELSLNESLDLEFQAFRDRMSLSGYKYRIPDPAQDIYVGGYKGAVISFTGNYLYVPLAGKLLQIDYGDYLVTICVSVSGGTKKCEKEYNAFISAFRFDGK